MTNETRQISIVVQSTQATKGLINVANALDDVAQLSGKTDAQLRKAERTIAKAAETSVKAARTMSQLKNELKTMSTELTRSGRENTQLAARMQTATRKIAEQSQIIRTQQGIIKAQTQANLRLAESYSKVESAAGRAGAAQSKAAAGVSGSGGGGGTTKPKAVQEVDPFANSLRYQLYDIAATFGVVGAAALVAGTQVMRTGIEWDKNFANVVRTSQVTGTAVGWLKEEFLQLQSAIPVTSADLAIIGTLGAQMGVAASNIANFTEITAKFSATSGLSVDESATALSRLDQLLPDVAGNYERLASTILKTGVNAVATEAQIVRGTSQIASMGRIAGMTTPEIVAMASALSSLGFSPELQRSIVTSSFSRILTATSEVTAQTEKFGAVLNMTGKEFQQAWRSDAVGTYKDLLETIAGRGDAVSVLKDLGLASQRLTPNLLKLGQNVEVLDAALADTQSEWGTNGELTRQYGVIANTVSAKIQVMAQSWEALLVTLDDSETVIGPLIDGLTGILKWMRTIAATPGISSLASIAGVIVTLTGVTALAGAGLAAMAAGYIAIQAVQRTLTLETVANTVATNFNTAAVVSNDVARARSALGLATQGLALGGNTAAITGNTAATAANGAGMLAWASRIITALPAILATTAAIGGMAAAAAGLYTVIATADTWSVELDKGVSGVDTFEKTIDFNIKKLNELNAKRAEIQRDQEKYDKFIANGGSEWTPMQPGGENGYNFRGSGGQAMIDNIEGQYDKYYKDIEESILGLTTMEDKLRAVNEVSAMLGVTQSELLSDILPGLGSALGDTGAAMAEAEEATVRLESAQALWAASLLTTDQNLLKLKEGLTAGANAFLDFGGALSSAYDGDDENGEGLQSFLDTMNGQIGGFEKFYGELGQLTQKGGVQLAALFAAQGPAAAQALTDSLALGPDQIAQIENQMSLAAFYASEEFADTFSQNNAILADVWRQTNSTEAVAAFNSALADSMKGGSVDPNVLAALSEQFGVKLNVDMIPSIDQEVLNTAVATTQATITPVKVPMTFGSTGQGDFTIMDEIDAWVVQMEGHVITLPVNPNTAEGQAMIQTWRDSEYNNALVLKTWSDTTGADGSLEAWRLAASNRIITIQVRAMMPDLNGLNVSGNGLMGTIATGGMIHNGSIVRDNYPRYARGGILRGPGTGTSDSIIARVANGEAITKARAVRYYGTQMMNDINHMRFPRYASGFTPNGIGGGGSAGSGQQVNVNVVQNYPTTRDPIKTMKADAESVVAGIWM